MKYRKIAEEISSHLELDIPPVGLSFVETIPGGIPVFDRDTPSACSFWRKAESTVFYAPAEKHFNCPVGSMVMGFDMPEAVQEELKGFVQKMCNAGYLSPEEAEKIPFIKKKKSGIVYGPLKDFPLEPDLVLMWLTPRQAMLYSEAAGNVRWTSISPSATFGRPACAALPIAFEQGRSALSLGCMGMRTFTEIQEDKILAVLPGKRVQEFLAALKVTLEANRAMKTFYQEHKAKFKA